MTCSTRARRRRCAARTGDGRNAAVSAVAQDRSGAVEEVGDGVAGDDDVVAVAGPGLSGNDHCPTIRADDDLGVDAAAVVFADRGDRLVVHGDQGAVDDPRAGVVIEAGPQRSGEHRDQGVDDSIYGGLAGAE